MVGRCCSVMRRTTPTIRWVICNTIALARPHHIDDRIEKALANPQTAKTFGNLGFRRSQTSESLLTTGRQTPPRPTLALGWHSSPGSRFDISNVPSRGGVG